MENNSIVKDFYESQYKEDGRLNRESLELTRSQIIISRYLSSEPLEIADVCGATGTYSFWLASMGHRVHLLDLVQSHIYIAQDVSRSSGITLASIACADARRLPYADASMDLVLLMGALYHLRSEEGRLQCLREAHRVLKPGGHVLCTVISRYVLVISTLKFNLFDAGVTLDDLEADMQSGYSSKGNLPLSYCHTPDEIRHEVVSAGFENPLLIAVEGIANALGSNLLPDDEVEASRLLRCIEMTESNPDLLGVSRNIIAVGRKPR